MARGRDWSTKQFKGGIKNDITKVTMRTGMVNARYQDGHTSQTTSDRTLYTRTSAEPPVERSQQIDVKNNDV